MEPSTRAMFRRADPIPFAEHRAFVARYLQADCTDHWFVVEVEGRPVGAIALYDFSVDRTAAQWGRFVIAPEHRGNGWGRRALSLLLEHARACGVHRLGCDVLAGNAAAGSLYESLGFVEDGTYDLSGRRFRRLIVIL
jgi:RimJ/RimL family protein N-acetyltransferase